MLDRFRLRASAWSQTLLRLLFVLLMVSVTGCGMLGGGGDDDEDKKYPEPPGRPDAAAVEMHSVPPLLSDTGERQLPWVR